jgi:hypothetical protein
MSLRVIGSGLGRTGTMSLKLALERLLGGPCYHMMEVGRAGHVDVWRRAATGDPPDWRELFAGWVAAVDWPVAPFWPALADAFPDAIIVHTERADTATWQRSAHRTILRDDDRHDDEFESMWLAVAGLTFDGRYTDPVVTGPAYERHNRTVRATAPPHRLVVHRPGDGWEPLCAALGMDEPDEPYPHVNSTEEFQERRRARREEE